MKPYKLLSIGLIVPFASTLVLFNSQQAQAQCGFGDITCRPSRWTCPIGGCNPGRPAPQSTVGRDMTRTVPLWIDNRSGRTVMHVYLSPSSSTSWGQDILGQSVLRSGQRWNASVRDQGGCIYDFRAVLEGGGERTLMNFNACTVGGVNIFP
jgi:hypothetical protein